MASNDYSNFSKDLIQEKDVEKSIYGHPEYEFTTFKPKTIFSTGGDRSGVDSNHVPLGVSLFKAVEARKAMVTRSEIAAAIGELAEAGTRGVRLTDELNGMPSREELLLRAIMPREITIAVTGADVIHALSDALRARDEVQAEVGADQPEEAITPAESSLPGCIFTQGLPSDPPS